MKFFRSVIHSFPLKLLLVHFKHNQVLLVYWVILFGIVEGKFGKSLGIPFLFLDPIYLGEVGFLGPFILGLTLGGFAMAFNITSYILDGFRFQFLGTLPRPFAHFCLNNATIPIAFLIFYVFKIIDFHRSAAMYSTAESSEIVGSLIAGYITMLVMLFTYFKLTNRDIEKVLARRKIKGKREVDRINAFRQLKRLKKKPVKTETYLSLKFKWFSTRRFESRYERISILGIFKQNQRNAIIAELFLILVVFGIGVFQDSDVFQIPAGASLILLLTVFVMATGALSYWLRSWVVSTLILILFALNIYSSEFNSGYVYPAFGLDYQTEPTAYNLNQLEALASADAVEGSRGYWIQMLENWKQKTEKEKPRMLLVAVSGGGQRAALWTTKALQQADSVLQGGLMDETFLITGASGGLIGAAFYRDLYWKNRSPQSPEHLEEISDEILNPLIFTLLVNDLFFKVNKFSYADQTYKRERGYVFEESLKQNLSGMLDRPISAYREAEFNAEIPKLLVIPLITNDGRKLYISPHPVQLFNAKDESNSLVQGVDLRALLSNHQPDSLRFLTALRMSATFPYVVPTITLPTSPPVQIADAGISDNYGVVDALIFLNKFEDWIKENTSEVVLLTIRDSKKEEELQPMQQQNILQRFFSPIQSVYKSWDKVQTIKNDQWFEMTKERFGNQLQRVELQYAVPDENRASLSWRLTEIEKKDILDAIYLPENQAALKQLEK